MLQEKAHPRKKKQKLGNHYSYGDIKLVLAHQKHLASK
jgi:hypothetical protein